MFLNDIQKNSQLGTVFPCFVFILAFFYSIQISSLSELFSQQNMKMQKFHLEHIFKYLEIERLHEVDDVRWPSPDIVPFENGAADLPQSKAESATGALLSELVSYPIREIGSIGFYRIYNQLIARRLIPGKLECRIVVPENFTSSDEFCANAEADLQRLCEKSKISIDPIQRAVHPGLRDPWLFLEMIAGKKNQKNIPPMDLQAESKLILVNPLAGIPISFLSELYPEKIVNVFDPLFLKLCQDIKLENLLSVRKFVSLSKKILQKNQLFLPTQGGISNCCYKICQESGLGIEIDLEAVPMLVPSKILCDLFRLDILSIDSTGSVLIICESNSAAQLIDACLEKNIIAAQIGVLTDEHQSCLFNGTDGEKAKMYKPACDELLRYRFRM